MTNWAKTSYAAGSYPKEWAEKIKKLVVGKSVLDLCCGPGRFTELFDPEGYLGIDISKQNIKIAKLAHHNHRFVCSDAIRWDGGVRFDNVFTWVALQHIKPKQFPKLAEKINRWSDNIIMGENLAETDSNYQFKHDYDKYFDIVSKENIIGEVYLMRARRKNV